MDDGHESGSLAFEYVFWKSFREGKAGFFMTPRPAQAGAGRSREPADGFGSTTAVNAVGLKQSSS